MKRMIILVITLLSAAFAASGGPAHAEEPGKYLKKEIFLCSEEREWRPFICLDDDKVAGIHADIVKEALSRAGFTARIVAYPLKRCLKMAEHGQVDGIISLPYNKRYAQYFEYPPNTANIEESSWRIMQIDDVVITPIENQFEFEGQVMSLPQPVRIVSGNPIEPYLEQGGIKVEEADDDRQNLLKLVRDKTGSVITSSISAETFFQDDAFKDKIWISAEPFRSESFFLAFAWTSGLTAEEKQRIWDEIEKVRKDYIFMLGLFARY